MHSTTPASVSKQLLIYIPLTVFAVLTLIPFAYLVFSAFKTQEAFFTSPFWPINQYEVDGRTVNGPWYDVNWNGLTLDNFINLFTMTGIGRAVVNSAFLASVTSILATLGSAMGGYALAKYEFPGRRLITNTVLISLVIPGALLLAPTYQLLYWMGLLDSFAGLIVPAMAPAFGVYLFRQAVLTSVPDAMLEAGRIDGCSEMRLFFTMVVPMVKPMIGAFVLITFLGTWNNFIGPQIILQTPEKFPLAVAVAQMRGLYNTDYGMIMAGTLVSIAPVLALFLMLQRDFIAGLTSGAVKG
ncbi:carbohydrate ABC transporter permease [Mucisphaera calidilacus]|uniref:L-arabinose transport system permease protein AraQ n=1 Tax=Mucisphaera calidilacus TaxID=2527982 RepID=A0A518BYI1_9BACT|nr:carbohydrate ABC transporter permease [Mucisphaera calidilacus]QDU72033.1 L-arabinose transport system permease protein AraQ [Mucisphaera calidilacus]